MIKLLTTAAISTTLLMASPANAEWPNEAMTYRGYKKDLYWSQYHCNGRYRPEGCDRWRWRRWKARQAVPRPSGDALCQQVVPATGEQAQSEDSAWESATTIWRGQVRFLYGERYTDPRKARGIDKVCAPSSVPDSARDKALAPLYRCRFSARPCRIEARKWKDD